MYTLGPFTLTPGTPVGPLVIGRDVGAVQIHNDSPYKLYVAAQAQAPTATDSMEGQYLTLAGPWGHPVVRLQPRAGSRAEQAPNAISDFAGVLWLMPVDPQASLARSGALSSLAEFHLDVYSPWEQPPEAWAMPRQFDLTSQPRVVTIPAVPDFPITGSISGLAVSSTKYDGTGTSQWTAGANGTNVFFYLWALEVSPYTPATGTYDCDLVFVADLRTAAGGGGTLISSTPLFGGVIAAQGGAGASRYGPAYRGAVPVAKSVLLNANTTGVLNFGFNCPGGSATITGFRYTAVLSYVAVDAGTPYLAPAPVGGIGHNGQGYAQPGGIIY